MQQSPKTAQMQLRVSPAQKRAIKLRAKQAGQNMSDWILNTLLPPSRNDLQEIFATLARTTEPSYALADLNDLLSRLLAAEFQAATAEKPADPLSPYLENYIAALIEHAAAQKGVPSPTWTQSVRPLRDPHFGVSLKSLRLHLLTNAPPAFRNRNIFIDSSIGDRV